MRIPVKRTARRVQLVVLGAAAFLVVLFPNGSFGEGSIVIPPGSNSGSCIGCHSRAEGTARAVVDLHAGSSHRRIGCEACHHGQADAEEKSRAHSGNFVARPSGAQTLTMCAACHELPLELLKTGRHFRRDLGTARIDCVTCHGAHTVGNPPETFAFTQLCAGCHGLEYLPRLPASIQQLLDASDQLRRALKAAEARATTIPSELIDGRKDIRHRVSAIVHPTDTSGGAGLIPGIIEDSRSLAERLGRLGSKGER